MKGTDAEIQKVLDARKVLLKAQDILLKNTGWRGHKSDYDGMVRWTHPMIGTLISRATAVDLAMGELEYE